MEIELISEEAFWNVYRPLPAPEDSGNGGWIWDHADARKQPESNVWTVIEGDQTENLYASPGYHFVNAIGYCVTEQPWRDASREAIYSDKSGSDS